MTIKKQSTGQDAQTIKDAAVGRWPEIIADVAGIDVAILDGKNHPCPKCGGKDRFRMIDTDAGAVYCNQCFRKKNGDGLAAIRWMLDCTFQEALQAAAKSLGLDDSPSRTKPVQNGISQQRSTSKETSPISNEPPEEIIVRLYPSLGMPSKIWPYHVEAGHLVGIVARWETADGKTIRPAMWNGSEWKSGAMHEPRPLYQLPEVIAASGTIWVAEGEKAADALREIGLTATTSSGGCNSAKKSDWSVLAGRNVVIWPDNDEPGERFAKDVIEQLRELKPLPTVRIVRPANIPAKGDAFDWCETRDAGEPEVLRGELESMADASEPVLMSVEGEIRKVHGIDTDTTPSNPKDLRASVDAPPVEGFKPFPLQALPQPVRGFVEAGAKAIGCDPSFLAVPMLVICGAAIGNSRRIRLKQGWTEPPILWAALVAYSGEHKSPALETALKAIRDRQRKLMKDYDTAHAEWKTAVMRHDRDLAGWKRSKGSDDPPEQPIEPVANRLLVDDSTLEALAGLLKHSPRGLLLACDELAAWLGSFERYSKGSDVSKWLEMHGGRMLMVDRKTGQPRTLCIPHASVSVLGGIQPEILKRNLSTEHRENGLSARLLLAMPPRKAKRWTEACIQRDKEQAIAELIERLLSLQMAASSVDDDPQPQLVALDQAAKALFVEFYNEHAAEQSSMTGELRAAWSKLEAYVPRVALIHHLIRWGNGEIPPDNELLIDAASMKAAIETVRWFAHEARRVNAMLREAPEDRERRELCDEIRQRGGRISARDLQRNLWKFRSSADLAQAALDDLVRCGMGRWEQVQTGGRPVEEFVLHDQHIDTSPPNRLVSATSVGVDAEEIPETHLGNRYFQADELDRSEAFFP